MFRDLRADEIECRIGTVSQNGKGLSLLLYKTARVDADILDETVGPYNWQCKFYECKNTLFCSVGILIPRVQDKGLEFKECREWIWKDDAGSPSQMESEKGEASDAFKRACFKHGIGRELYTAPFIWVPNDKAVFFNDGKKWVCRDKFSVAKISITNKKIDGLRIINNSTGQVAFLWKDNNGQ